MWPCLHEIFDLSLDETPLKQWELRLHRLLFHVPCTVTLLSQFSAWCSSAVTLFLSPHCFQMPVYLACAITLFLSPHGFQLPTFHAGWCSSVVIFLLRGFSCHSFAFTGTFLLCGSLSFSSSLSSTSGTIPLPPLSQSFTLLFHCLCSMSSSVSFLWRRQSSCSCTDLTALLGLLCSSMF